MSQRGGAVLYLDVLYGRSLVKKRRFGRRPDHNKKRVVGVCRSCQGEEAVLLSEFHRAARVRCSKCGGQMDRAFVPDRLQRIRRIQDEELDSLVYPRHYSEFEIQSFVYWTLRGMGYDVRGGVRTARGQSILDLVGFVDKVPVRIIETKSGKRQRGKKYREKEDQSHARQLERYKRYGVTIDRIKGMTEAELYCEEFLAIIESEPPFRGVWPPLPDPFIG